MADLSAEIAKLETILNAGTEIVMIDGLMTRYNLPEVRKRLAELQAQNDTTIESGKVRPRSARIRLDFN